MLIFEQARAEMNLVVNNQDNSQRVFLSRNYWSDGFPLEI